MKLNCILPEPMAPLPMFTNWISWQDRNADDLGIDLPGVWIIAEFEDKPTGDADSARAEIIYISRTLKPLYKAWNIFTLTRTFSSNLYVSWYPVIMLKPLEAMAYIEALKSQILYNYTWKYGQPPKLNYHLDQVDGMAYCDVDRGSPDES